MRSTATWIALAANLATVWTLAQIHDPTAVPTAPLGSLTRLEDAPLPAPGVVVEARSVTWAEILATGSNESEGLLDELPPPAVDAPARGPGKTPGAGASSVTRAYAKTTQTRPYVGLRFPGADLPTTLTNPPDTMGAIGPGHFVELINGSFAVYDKRTGLRLRRVPLVNFFAIVDGFKFDPRVFYDRQSSRWIAVAARSKFEPERSLGVVMAVSHTDDPLADWFQVFFQNPTTRDSLHDFPTLGVGSNGIYVEATIFAPGNRRAFFAFEKRPLVSHPPYLGAVNLWEYSGDDPRLVAAQSYGSSGGDFALGVPPGGGYLTVYAIEGSGASPVLRLRGQVPAPIDHRDTAVAPAPNPGRPDPILLPAGPYMSGAPVYRNRSIWVALRAGYDNRSAVHWLRINPFAALAQIVDSGVIGDPELSLQHPSVAVNEIGDVVFSFTASSARSFPAAYVAGRRGSDAPGTIGPLLRTKAGEAAFGVTDAVTRRWGDYSATCVDPDDDRTFWTIQQYAGFQGTQDTWGLWVSQLRFGPFDCNSNEIDDQCDVDCSAPGCDASACGESLDCQGNGVPDDCEPTDDCDHNGLRDACEIQLQLTPDCNENGVPDVCDPGPDCNVNRIPDECEQDCNSNGRPDDCDLSERVSADCNGNELPDECELAPNFLRTSYPRDGQTLWRTTRNVVRLDFVCDLVRTPEPEIEITIAQILDNGYLGEDFSATVAMQIEHGHVLRIEDVAGRFRHGRWYSIAAPSWPGVQYFSIGLPVLVGDANADARVDASDLERIDSAIPAFGTADDERRDIDGDRRVLYSDISAAAARAPSEPPPRPVP